MKENQGKKGNRPWHDIPSNVIDNEDTMGTSVVGSCNCAERFLTSLYTNASATETKLGQDAAAFVDVKGDVPCPRSAI